MDEAATLMPPTDNKPGSGKYDFTAIEARWQQYWEEHQTFKTLNPGDGGADPSRPKFYILDMFPYPSGAGLHVGHPLGYCASDIIARYKRMRGYNVLHPMGFDAFGLPAEQYAIEHGVHPRVTTKHNIDTYRRQLKMFGFSYDWSREVATCDPPYYKFTQWIFLRMFESWYDDRCVWVDPQGHRTRGRARPISELQAELEAGRLGVTPAGGLARDPQAPGVRRWSDLSEAERRKVIDGQRLAYLDEVPVNWCPALGTVLANEEVDAEGRSARGGHPVYRRPLRQWMLRITKYADRLLEDIEDLEWPEPIKLMQRNWVGRSTGADCLFLRADKWACEGGRFRCNEPGVQLRPGQRADVPYSIRVYTTRPDTLFGATYMVLAPEHPLVEEITTSAQRAAVREYVETARHKSDLDRTAETKEKTGVFTGAYALNPVNGNKVPIWVADYVLMGYGTGAIMAVPAHDTRDFEFAKKFDIPIIAVVLPPDEWFREQLRDMAVDGTYCEKTNRGGWLQRVQADMGCAPGTMQGVYGLQAGSRLDADPSWLRQVVISAFAEDPAVFAEAFVGDGTSMNSDRFDGLPTAEFKTRITAWLEEQGLGWGAVNYKLRDWVFSRQKYWGEPFPVRHGPEGAIEPLADEELPLELPPMEDFKPTTSDNADALPEPPLGRARQWVTFERNGKTYRHDVNTMPQWAGSCWYYLRFIDPHNQRAFCDSAAERYWMPVDQYIGGAEHAVLHLLYARFWHKVLLDRGYVSTREPFQRLFNQGMIQSYAYRDARGVVVGPDRVEERGQDAFVLKDTGEPVTRIVAKMSKSLKNVVSPDEIIAQYGADTFRLYEMYMGPLEASKPWNTRDVPGLFRLCERIWRLVVDPNSGGLTATLTDDPPDEPALKLLHKTIQRITDDIEQIKLNTAIAAMFEFVNAVGPCPRRPRGVIEPFVLLAAPFAPHLAEELWHRLGHSESIAYAPWPACDGRYLVEDTMELAVQVQGKIKARITVPAGANDEDVKTAALAEPKVAAALAGKSVQKVFVVKGRLVNIIVR